MTYYSNENSGLYNGRVVDCSNYNPSGQRTASKTNQYTAVSLDPEFDLDLSGEGRKKPLLTGTIHVFPKHQSSVYGRIEGAMKPVLNVRIARRALVLISLNLIVLSFLISWCNSSNSIALQAFSYLAVFDLLTLLIFLASTWLSSHHRKYEDDHIHVLSPERTEVLMVFAAVVLSTLGAVFNLKEGLLRVLDQPDIAIGRLIPGALVGFFFHVVVAFSIHNRPLKSIAEASSSSVIQEHISDLSNPVCSSLPFLRSIFQPRIDPFFLLSSIGAVVLLLTDLLIQIDLYFSADTAASILLAICTITTMFPVAVCSARVLLNTTPPYVLGQLDKLLSEAQTLDGVLEIRNERFHTMALSSIKDPSHLRSTNGFGLLLAGSISVRVRRDADEQMVLAHVTNRLSPLVAQLTVQIMKDEWNNPNPALPNPIMSSSSIIYGFNKPAAAVAPYQQTPPAPYQQTPFSKPPSLPQANKLLSKTPHENDACPDKAADDGFCFSAPLPNQLKSHSHSSAGANIARMYKAAGFTAPPPGSKRVSGLTGASHFAPTL